MTDREKQGRAAWRHSRERSTNRNTVRTYELAINRWFEHFEGVDPLDPTNDECRDTLRRMMPNAEPAAWNTAVSGLGTLFRVLRREGLTRNGVVSDHRMKHPDKRRVGYPLSEVTAMLLSADAVDRALLLMVVDAGLTPKQALSRTWSHVGHEHTLEVDGRTVRLSPRLDAAIHALPHRSGFIVTYGSQTRMRQRVARVCRRAKVEYKGVDVMRQWAA